MELKRVARYRMNFEGKWPVRSGFFVAIAIFLWIVHYFVLQQPADTGVGTMILSVILPLLILGVYAFLLAGLKAASSELYGILAAAYCVMMILWSFSSGSVLATVLGTVWYLACAVVAVVTAFGYLPSKYFSAGAFAVPVVFWLAMDLPGFISAKDWLGLIPAVFRISPIAGFACMSMGFEKRTRKRK